MPRMARIVIPDVPHHVTQRGNRREDVFFADDDRRRYLLCSQKTLKLLRLRTRTGRPAGDAAFVARLEELSGRFLAPRVGGRPKKARKDGGPRKHG